MTSRLWQITSVVLLLALVGVALHAYVLGGREMVNVKKLHDKYPLIDISRHFISKKDFLPTLQPLRERLYDFVASEKDMNVSVYIEFLNTGANIHINPETRFFPASFAKIPLALAVMGTVENGRWTLDKPLSLEDRDRAPLPSTIRTRPVGTRFTVKELLEELLVRSDNTAYKMFLRNIPQSEILAVKEAIGLEDLFNEEGKVTAKEFSRTMRALYTASYLNREDSEFLLELLNRSEFKDFLRRPIPEEIPFPHKYGVSYVSHSYNDSGIVYLPDRPYLITVMMEIKGEIDEKAERERATRVMGTISNMSYKFFSDAGI